MKKKVFLGRIFTDYVNIHGRFLKMTQFPGIQKRNWSPAAAPRLTAEMCVPVCYWILYISIPCFYSETEMPAILQEKMVSNHGCLFPPRIWNRKWFGKLHPLLLGVVADWETPGLAGNALLGTEKCRNQGFHPLGMLWRSHFLSLTSFLLSLCDIKDFPHFLFAFIPPVLSPIPLCGGKGQQFCGV